MVTPFLFFPEKNFYELPKNFGLREKDVQMKTADGVELHGWFFEIHEPNATLLFFHGNAGNISGRLLKAKGWLERGVSVFLVDYRGYGKSQGKIEKVKDLMTDAEAALAWLVNEQKISTDKIILYGESVGSYPATQLARQKKFAGLVLEGPFTTLAELANKHYQGVPEFLLKDFSMNNPDAIREAQAPVFVMHGAEDEICPREMGEKIYECAPSPKELYVVPGGGHNDLPAAAGENYFEYPYRFLAKENGFAS